MSTSDYQVLRAIAAILGVAFAAFCIWLGVRIFNRRERWAKWTLAAVLGLPLLYILSFGPACWLNDWGFIPGFGFGATYTPLLACIAQSSTASDAVGWYGELLSPSYLNKRGTTADYLLYSAKSDWLPHKKRKRSHRP